MNSLIIVSCKIEFQLHGIVIAEKKEHFMWNVWRIKSFEFFK